MPRAASLRAPALLVAATLLAVSFSGCLTSHEDTVVIGHLWSVTQPEIFVAVDKGWLAEELGPGVKIERRAYESGTQMMSAMQNGELDIAYAGSVPAIFTFQNWSHMRIVAGTNVGGTVLVARNASDVHSIEDLGGKTIAIPALKNFQDIVLRAVILKEAGLAPTATTPNSKEVKIITSPPQEMGTKLREGSADAAITFEPWGATILHDPSVQSHLLLDWREVWRNGSYPSSVVVASDAFIQGKHDLLVTFLRAHVRAAQFAMENPEETNAIMDRQFGVQGLSPGLEVVSEAASRARATYDPSMQAVLEFADLAAATYPSSMPKLRETVNLFYLGDLNNVLEDLGLPPVPWG